MVSSVLYLFDSRDDKNGYAGMDQIMGKMEVPGSYHPYLHAEDYNMTG